MTTLEKLEYKTMNLYSKYIKHLDDKHKLRAEVYHLRYKLHFKRYINKLLSKFKEDKYE